MIKVEIVHDNKASVYVATSQDLPGLIVEAETLENLEKEVIELIPELLALTNPSFAKQQTTQISFHEL